MPSWEDIAATGRRLPGVEVGTWFGTPGLKVAGKGFCRIRTDPDALVNEHDAGEAQRNQSDDHSRRTAGR